MEDARDAALDGHIEKYIKAKAAKAKAHDAMGKHLEAIGAAMKAGDRRQYTLGTDKFLLLPGHDVVKHKPAKSQ